MKFVTAAVLVFACLGAQTAYATTIYDSITTGNAAYYGDIGLEGPHANEFLSTATPADLTSVSLVLYNFSLNSTGYTNVGSIQITLYSNSAANTPGNSLEALGAVSSTSITSEFQTVTLNSFAPYLLSANTEYWIYVSTSDGSELAVIDTSNLSGTGVLGQYNYEHGRSTLVNSLGFATEMSVTSSTPSAVTPEPSTLSLCALASFCGFFLFRRSPILNR